MPVQIPAVVNDTYVINEVLGKGSFSIVRKVMHKVTGKEYAMKIIEKSLLGDQIDSVRKEIGILKNVHHPNITELVDVFEAADGIFIIMELIIGGELLATIIDRGSLTEREASTVIYQLMSALHYLHSQGIVHRDIKPENILLREKGVLNIVLADFGLSEIVGKSCLLKTLCGTPSYVAPEVLAMTGYGYQVDLWSAGVVLYLLLCGSQPFYAEDLESLLKLILSGTVEFDSDWNSISDPAKDLVKKLLVVDPSKRLTCDEALEHPWVAGHINAPDRPLLEVVRKIRKFNARRNFQNAIFSTMARRKRSFTTLVKILHSREQSERE